MLMNEVRDTYDKFYVCSPSLSSDVKQQNFFQQLEKEGKFVQYYDNLDEETVNGIVGHIKDDLEEYKRYEKIVKVIEKLRKYGEKKLTNDDLEIIGDYLLLSEDDNFDNIDEILDQFPSYFKREGEQFPPRSFWYIDDFFASKLLSQSRNNPLLWAYIRNRHLRVSFAILVQAFTNLPRPFRNNATLLLLWTTKSIKDKRVIYEELSSIFNSYEEFDEVMKEVGKEEHQFLYLDLSSCADPDIRIGFEKKLM